MNIASKLEQRDVECGICGSCDMELWKNEGHDTITLVVHTKRNILTCALIAMPIVSFLWFAQLIRIRISAFQIGGLMGAFFDS